MDIHPQLYKRDSAGRIRTWYVIADRENARYAYDTGLQDGARVQSGWTTAVGKQGRTDAEQVDFEVAAAYKHQLDRDYFERPEDVDTPKVTFPMLCSKYKKWPGAGGWVQPKLDGMRCIAKAGGLFSRQGKPIESVPHIAEALKPFFEQFPDAILDGELYNHELHDQFENLMSLCRKSGKHLTSEILEQTKVVQYHVYDYPSAPGGFGARWEQLDDDVLSVRDFPAGCIFPVQTVHCGSQKLFDELFERWLDEGFEGGIWRGAEGDYVFSPTARPTWLQKRTLKLKEEFDFIGFENGNGNWAGIPKSAKFWLPGADRSAGPTKDNTFSAGIKGTEAQNLALLDREIGQGTVEFKGWTAYGKPRCGVVIDWHGLEGRVD